MAAHAGEIAAGGPLLRPQARRLSLRLSGRGPRLTALLVGDLVHLRANFRVVGQMTDACLMTFVGSFAIREPQPGTPTMPGCGGGRIENGLAMTGHAVV